MKKIALLLSFISCMIFTQAQTNLLVGPSFEKAVAGSLGVPEGWTYTATGTPSMGKGLTGNALQFVATATSTISQNVLPPAGSTTFDTNITYQLSVNYLVTVGDGTDARVWSGLVTSAPGVTPVTYFAVPKTKADSLLYYLPIHGPGGSVNPPSGVFGNDLNGYLLDNRTSGVWHNYTCDVKFPEGITQFNFAVRTYTGSTVLWDDMFFGVKTETGFSTQTINDLKLSVIGKNLTVKNIANGSLVEIYSIIGSKVQSSQIVNNTIQINDLPNGMYIVRVGNRSSRIFL